LTGGGLKPELLFIMTYVNGQNQLTTGKEKLAMEIIEIIGQLTVINTMVNLQTFQKIVYNKFGYHLGVLLLFWTGILPIGKLR
jgi:hypothetical protein